MSFLAPYSQPLHAYQLVLPLLVGSVAHEANESAAFAYCDGEGRLRGLRHVRSSLTDAVDISIRRVVVDTIELNAQVVVMAHNHPRGQAWPSRADRDVTRRLALVLRAIGVRLHDHVIVAERKQWSFRAAGLV